jgi:hypothetical protein
MAAAGWTVPNKPIKNKGSIPNDIPPTETEDIVEQEEEEEPSRATSNCQPFALQPIQYPPQVDAIINLLQEITIRKHKSFIKLWIEEYWS